VPFLVVFDVGSDKCLSRARQALMEKLSACMHNICSTPSACSLAFGCWSRFSNFHEMSIGVLLRVGVTRDSTWLFTAHRESSSFPTPLIYHDQHPPPSKNQVPLISPLHPHSPPRQLPTLHRPHTNHTDTQTSLPTLNLRRNSVRHTHPTGPLPTPLLPQLHVPAHPDHVPSAGTHHNPHRQARPASARRGAQ
jgi:hypothetical protein